MVIVLLVVIAVLLMLLLTKRGSGHGYRNRPYQDRPYERPYERPYYDPYDYGPRSGFSGGSFLGGMAAGAFLTYLLEQGRIDAGQYDYFNSLGQQQMMDELIQQNIIQQDEIDNLQHEIDDGNFNGPDNFYDPGNSQDFYPNDNSYVNDVDYNDYNNNDNNNNGDFNDFGNDFSDNGGGDNWV